MKTYAKVFCSALILSLIILAGCSQKPVVNDIWIDEPYYDRQYGSVLVIGVAEKITFRNIFEGELVNKLKNTGIEAIPSTVILPYDSMLTREAVLSAVEKYAIDSVLITSLVGRDTKTIYYSTENSNYTNPYSWNRFIGNAARPSRESGKYEVEILFLKTNLYDVSSEKLVWSLTSETEFKYQMKSLNAAIKLIINKLREDGLI